MGQHHGFLAAQPHRTPRFKANATINALSVGQRAEWSASAFSVLLGLREMTLNLLEQAFLCDGWHWHNRIPWHEACCTLINIYSPASIFLFDLDSMGSLIRRRINPLPPLMIVYHNNHLFQYAAFRYRESRKPFISSRLFALNSRNSQIQGPGNKTVENCIIGYLSDGRD
jgi:hypothetical protein